MQKLVIYIQRSSVLNIISVFALTSTLHSQEHNHKWKVTPSVSTRRMMKSFV